MEPGDARTHALASMTRYASATAPGVAPAPPTPRERFLVLQEWEGTVLERRAEAIRVRLKDKTTPAGGAEEEAEIVLEEISEQDRDLVKPGAVFYWTIGYHDSPAGQRTRQSVVVFRRLPAWTQSELAAINEKVRQQNALFRWT